MDSNREVEWRPIASLFNLYEISSQGDLRRVPRVTPDGKHLKARNLTGRADDKGYVRYGLGIDGVRYSLFAHRLVCEAFHGPAPEGKPNALHRDGDSMNNTPENLYWGSASENNYDTVRHGTHFNASKTHCPQGHPFTEENVYLNERGWRTCRICVNERHRVVRSSDEYREWRREYDRKRTDPR